MNIHGVISTYFGDLEYDIGKSLNWTQYFCDTIYVMDTNNADSSRRYVVDWARSFPKAKYSFYSGSPAFFGSAETAASWRKQSFARADSSWNYSSDDWVLFIDGTETLNVFHKPPVVLDLMSIDIGFGISLFTTSEFSTDDVFVGAKVSVAEAFFGEDQARLSGTATITAVDEYEHTFTVDTDFGFGVEYGDLGDQDFYRNANGEYPKVEVLAEPPGFYAGDMFQSWITYEVSAAEEAGKSLISLDGWAMVRSEMSSVLVKVINTGFTNSIFGITESDGHPAVEAPRCDEFYVPMDNLVRLVKVSALRDPDFDWQVIDQPHTSLSDVHPAEYLSIISYAYVRWAERATDMTQDRDPTAPHFVDGSAANPPLRPVSIDTDTGFAMRRLISTVRPLAGLPRVWEGIDDDGVQPLVGGIQKLDTFLYETYGFEGFSGYKKYGGSPLYPGVLRKNLREGVWYAATGNRPIRIKLSYVSHSGGVSVFTTAYPHYLDPGTKVTVYGTDNPYFDGEYTIYSIPLPNTFSCIRNIEDGFEFAETQISDGFIVTMTNNMGSIPWNYLLNTFSIPDPFSWIRTGSRVN